MTNSSSPQKKVILNPDLARQDLWFHPGEELPVGNMRVTLMGTGWGSVIRPNQKGASIYLELGVGGEKKIETFVFDAGPGSGINYNVMGIPFSRMDKIFLTHLHTDHCSDLDWIYTFGPSTDRFTPLQIWGPHRIDEKRDSEANTRFAIPDMDEFAQALMKLTHWHRVSFESCLQVCDGYGLHYTKLDYKQTPPRTQEEMTRTLEKIKQVRTLKGEEQKLKGVDKGPIDPIPFQAPGTGIAYYHQDDENEIVITHWPALHIIDGAISYGLEWKNLKTGKKYKVVWSGDTQPNYYITEYGKDADLFIHETAPSAVRFGQASGLEPAVTQNIVAQSHTPAKALGKILSIAQPKLAVTCHSPIDPEEWENYIEGVQFWWPEGQYQIGEDLMVFTLSSDKTAPTVRKGSIVERPWNTILKKNSNTSSEYPIDNKQYRTGEIFNTSDQSPPGHHISDSDWEVYSVKNIEQQIKEKELELEIAKEKLLAIKNHDIDESN